MLYWLCRELLACIGWGAAFIAVFFALCFLAIDISDPTTVWKNPIPEPLIAPLIPTMVFLAFMTSCLFILLMTRIYNFIKSICTGSVSDDDRAGWSRFKRIVFRTLIGVVIIALCLITLLSMPPF